MTASLFSETLAELPVGEAIAETARLGYPAIELLCGAPHLDHEQARHEGEAVADRIRDAGLAVSVLSLHNSFTEPDRLAEQLGVVRTFMALAPAFGTGVLQLDPGRPAAADAEPEHWQCLARALDELAAMADDAGVKLAFHTTMRQITSTVAIGQAAWIDIPNTAWPGFDLSFGPVFWALLPAFVFVTLGRRHRNDRRRRGDPAGVVAPAARRRFPRGAGCGGRGRRRQPALRPRRHGAEHHLFDQHRGDRTHRRGGARRRGRHRRHLPGTGLPAQGARRGAGDSAPGGGGLHHRTAGDAVRHRHEDGHSGRHRLPQGPGRGDVVLGRRCRARTPTDGACCWSRARKTAAPCWNSSPPPDKRTSRITLLDAHSAEVPEEREISLRLLRHLASSVRHEQYHDTEIVTVRVDTPRTA